MLVSIVGTLCVMPRLSATMENSGGMEFDIMLVFKLAYTISAVRNRFRYFSFFVTHKHYL